MTYPGHAEDHNEAASLLDIHLERPVQSTDTLDNHTELHNQIRDEILRLRSLRRTVMTTKTENLEAPYLPVEVDQVTLAFPAQVRYLMPAEDEIPEEFWDTNRRNKWVQFQMDWFYKGLPGDTVIDVKDGIDGDTAIRHLKAIQGSFEPKHEYKIAAVAFLASRWFNDVAY